MPWYYAVVERNHELQNPTSAEKIRRVGELLRLGPRSHVLDVASGRAGPALVLAETFGCRLTCVERATEFHAAAEERVREARLGHLIELVHADAHDFALDPGRYDAALCLGASFVWDGLAGTLAALTPAVRANGSVAVGEPYWRTWPVPTGFDAGDYAPLPETVARLKQGGVTLVGIVDASLDDWDRYESLHWLAAEEWLGANADDPDAPSIRAQHDAARERYLTGDRELLGWAIFVGRKAA